MAEKSKMKLHPFIDCCDKAQELMVKDHVDVYQQWNCQHCGVKQTMENANVFYRTGKCEECGQITNIVETGCNYMVHARLR